MTLNMYKNKKDRYLSTSRRVLNHLMDYAYEGNVKTSQFKSTYYDMKKRQVLTTWMLNVSDEEKCEHYVLPLAVNYVDRFLVENDIQKNKLQLLGAVCLFVASKLTESLPISADKLVMYTDFSIKLEDLMEWEVILLESLHWYISVPIALEIVHHILPRIPIIVLDGELSSIIELKAKTLLELCVIDGNFIDVRPSYLAGAALSQVLKCTIQDSKALGRILNFIRKLTKLSSIDVNDIMGVQETINRIFY